MQATSTRQRAAGWVAIAVLFAATTCVESMSWTQLTAYTRLYLRELHVPAGQVPAWIAAMSSLGWILALPLAPFWGVLADRYSRKLVIIRSAALEAVVFAGWALATSPVIALVFRSLNGFILGNTGVMLAVQASTTPRQRLALAVGIDVRGMLVDSALSVLMTVLLTVFMREEKHERPSDLRVLSLLRGALQEIAGKPLVWRLFLATAITQVGLWTVLPYVPIYIGRLEPRNVVTAIGIVLSSVGLGQAIASPLWGIAIQRMGYRKVLNATSIGAALALTTVALSHTLPVFALGLVANGIFAGAILTASMALMAATVSPERRGAVLGQILFPFYLGGVFGPPLGALAFGVGQAEVFGIAAVLSLAPLVVLLTLRPARPAAVA